MRLLLPPTFPQTMGAILTLRDGSSHSIPKPTRKFEAKLPWKRLTYAFFGSRDLQLDENMCLDLLTILSNVSSLSVEIKEGYWIIDEDNGMSSEELFIRE